MFRLLMVLAAAGIVYRIYRRRRKGQSDEDETSETDDSSSSPGAGLPKPTLDPALYRVPVQSWGDLFGNVIPGPDFGRPPSGTIINPPPMPGTVGNGQLPTVNQLSSVNNMWNAILGSIPYAIDQKIDNVKRLADFQSRVISNVAAGVKDTFTASQWTGPPVSYYTVNGAPIVGYTDPKTGSVVNVFQDYKYK
jgi:hypothetical protein